MPMGFDAEEKRGHLTPLPPTIELCADSLSQEPPQLFIDVIFEEVIHAITLCETAKPIDAGAFSHLRGIIEAHKLSGKQKSVLSVSSGQRVTQNSGRS